MIKGSGGGKSGGGSARVAKEAPDTLRSVQYAKVLDLVSEGEIAGLVNGEQSIIINDTPLLNENGQYNFSGVTVDYRVGTQGQKYMSGFPAVENEVAVSTEIKAALPITRTITNPNINAVRITMSVPALTDQNMKNGDMNGSSVTLRLDVQNNSGGFIPARLQVESINLSSSGTTATSGTNSVVSAQMNINWVGIVPWEFKYNPIARNNPIQYCNWTIEAKRAGGAWRILKTGVASGVVSTEKTQDGLDKFIAPTSSASISAELLEGTYEFRLLFTGTGTCSISNVVGRHYTPNITFNGKTTSRYQRSLKIDLPSPGPWDIRLSRVTPDSTKTSLQNSTYFDSYTEIIDTKLSYPNSALFGIKIDAIQFDSIPSRAYEIYGIKVKVPNNYNPITRVYTGEWNGDFNVAWTDNPAWIFYDIVSNTRYGLGEFIDTNTIDKWGLYSIGKYCDEFVDNGFGGQEPRFSCNAFIQTRTEAYSLIMQMASVFRALPYWSSEQITCVQDAPSDPVALFTSANVIDGTFNYQGSSAKARHTVCLVTWNDPKDRYRQKVEYVDDPEGVARYGVVQTEINAFGCTSRGQAHRMGRWLLYTERLETDTVTFRTGLDAALVYPGAVIYTQDQFRSGERYGGRVISATTSEITIDSSIKIESNKTYEISVILPDGSIASRNVTNTAGDSSVITISPEITQIPQPMAIWVMSASDLKPEEWRVISISEQEEGIVEISAMTSRQDKYAAVEEGLVLEPIASISVDNSLALVENVTIVEGSYLISQTIVGSSVDISWTGKASRYIVSYSSSGANNVSIDTSESSYTFKDIPPGVYTFSIQPVNAFGRRGQSTSVNKELFGLSNPPLDVTGLSLNAVSDTAHITFNPSLDLDVIVGGHLRLKHSRISNSWSDALDLGVYVAGSATYTVVPLIQGTYFAKWVDATGNESVNATAIYTTVPNILALNFIEEIIEHPVFLGEKTNIGVDDFAGESALVLDSKLTIDEIGLIDEQPEFSAWGGVSSSGRYLFDKSLDLGDVFTSRLSAVLKTHGYNPQDSIDLWPDIDTTQSIDGQEIGDVSATILVRTSNDAVNFGDWQPLIVGDYSARAFEFCLDLKSETTNNIAVTHCSVIVDMVDTIQSAEDVVSGDSVLRVEYAKQYYTNPAIGITAQDMQTGDYYTLSNKNNTGFDIVFKNSSGVGISRTFDYIAKGY